MFVEQLRAIAEITIDPSPIETNIVQFSIKRLTQDTDDFLSRCQAKGLLLFPWLPTKIRAVVHRPLTKKDIVKAINIIREVVREITSQEKVKRYAASL